MINNLNDKTDELLYETMGFLMDTIRTNPSIKHKVGMDFNILEVLQDEILRHVDIEINQYSGVEYICEIIKSKYSD